MKTTTTELHTFKTKQEGYGRQGLYVDINGEWHYLGSVFPNVKEHFNIDTHEELFLRVNEAGDYIPDERGNEVYTDGSGNVVNAVDSINGFLSAHYAEEIEEIINDLEF
jgi:hypothetical protein